MSNKLEERWKTEDGKDRLKRIIQAIRSGQDDWPNILKDFPEVKDISNGKDLRGVDLSDQLLIGANLSEIRFDGVNFHNTNLEKAVLTNATLGGACFNGKANLKKADLSGTYLKSAEFVAADIKGAKFNDSKLGGDFIAFGQGSTRANVDFSNVKFSRRTSFLGVDISNNNWACNPLLKRHIEDQQWLHTWRNMHRFNKYCLYPIWWISCDCGRSFIRWAFWSMILAICFGFIFRYNADCFHIAKGATLSEAHWFTPFYYSIVTFTTLGFGDVVPDITNGMMQLCVTLEVILGYLMLGGLISILATKLARRS